MFGLMKKGYNNLFNSWIDKKRHNINSFPKPNSLWANVKVESDLSNYATKTDLKMEQELIHHLLLKKLIEII